MSNTTEQLLQALKSRGPQAAATLAAACAITPMGAHKVLAALLEQGLVEAHDERGSVGRPKRIWALSGAGHARFPDRHGELTVQLLKLMDEPTRERLISAREAQMQTHYEAGLKGCTTLPARLRALAALRSAEGYMA
ncbi:MAG TPA: MarR family transcriptional regulator, partial [Burkholderiaceae bacterium]